MNAWQWVLSSHTTKELQVYGLHDLKETYVDNSGEDDDRRVSLVFQTGEDVEVTWSYVVYKSVIERWSKYEFIAFVCAEAQDARKTKGN